METGFNGKSVKITSTRPYYKTFSQLEHRKEFDDSFTRVLKHVYGRRQRISQGFAGRQKYRMTACGTSFRRLHPTVIRALFHLLKHFYEFIIIITTTSTLFPSFFLPKRGEQMKT